MESNDRRTTRLPGFAYDHGCFFLTICSASRAHLFGHISENQVHLTRVGAILDEEWALSPTIRPQLKLDVWVIMPNHFHALVWLEPDRPPRLSQMDVGAHCSAPLRNDRLRRDPRSLGSFMAEFKASVTRRVHGLPGREATRVWQRGYFERVIRDDPDLQATRRYILENPARWEADHLHRRSKTKGGTSTAI